MGNKTLWALNIKSAHRAARQSTMSLYNYHQCVFQQVDSETASELSSNKKMDQRDLQNEKVIDVAPK